jgi:hypothetical protein
MSQKSPRNLPAKNESPVPGKRFRIEKLEERIAPKKGGKGTHNCPLTGLCYTSGCGGY